MSNRKRQWVGSILYAVPIIILVGGLFYYWFAVVDRFVIFLYGHLGATAFDPITNGRYWMAGLVAGGFVFVLSHAVHAVIGRMNHTYTPPVWWHVWLCAALPLAVIVPAIVMNLNHPTLPLSLAVWVTAVTLLALALALPSVTIITRSLLQFAWLMVTGLGLVPSLLLLRVVELPQQGLVTLTTAYLVAFGSTLVGLFWFFFMGWLFTRKQHNRWTVSQLFLSGLQISYLLLPLVHYGLMTPPRYKYISSAQNFFASNLSWQCAGWSVALIGCGSLIYLQKNGFR